jgi:LacI family transcriptional regulator
MDMNGKAGSKSRGDMREVPRVALLVETSRGFGREFLLGMARYSRLHGRWIFHITPGYFKQVVP